MSLRDSIMNLIDRSSEPYNLLTEISLYCDDEVLSVCEKIREELANRESGATQMELADESMESDISRENQERSYGDDKKFNPVKWIEVTKEWIND